MALKIKIKYFYKNLEKLNKIRKSWRMLALWM